MSEEQVAAEPTNATSEEQVAEERSADKIFDGNAERPPEGPQGSEEKVEAKPEEDVSEGESASKEPEAESQYEFEVDDDEPITDEQLEEIAALARDNDLSNEAAQKLVDMQSKALQGVQEKLTEDLENAKQEWKLEAENDNEIGGVEFPRNVEMAKRVIDKYATEEFKQAVNETGLGNHPELLRVFTRIGRAMAEDSLVMPGQEAGKSVSIADKFYPTTSNN